ncbi:MAG: 4'-phosphopantetheinyl transferase superfamily protein [Clostridia bacterium]|nr:4'-phosphopantetheinyl transferase superfamily protein [Clostridia bacterium]
MELQIVLAREGGAADAVSHALGRKVRVEKRASGAPYIKGDEHYLSLSHKDDKMVVALSDKPVGVDIEKLVDKAAYYRIADNYFAEKIREGDCEGFFRGWTRREAFGKMLGKGLDGDVMRMDMSADKLEYQGSTVYFAEKRVGDYMITVAGYYPDGELKILGEEQDEE